MRARLAVVSRTAEAKLRAGGEVSVPLGSVLAQLDGNAGSRMNCQIPLVGWHVPSLAPCSPPNSMSPPVTGAAAAPFRAVAGNKPEGVWFQTGNGIDPNVKVR